MSPVFVYRRLVPLFMSIAVLAACQHPDGSGLAVSTAGQGPRVVFDVEALPLPEIPLPNNVATRYDPATRTGRRINVSIEAPTQVERNLRRKINQLDGFGVFAPITVSFDKELDLVNIRQRHTSNHSFKDDTILLLNVDRNSPGFGEAIPLDLGRGNYPLGLEWAHQYWDMDEHADSPNLLFETHNEDLNGNWKLDPYEDIDFDSVLDRPNTWSGKPITTIKKGFLSTLLKLDSRPIDDLITFYEKETNTLVAWPVVPLRQQTTYAVVLTKLMVGKNGKPVESPFKYVNHVAQNKELDQLEGILTNPSIDMSLDDVAFAWSFTTQTVTEDFEAIRAGLYGFPPLADLKDSYPPDLEPKLVQAPDASGKLPTAPYTLLMKNLDVLFDLVAGPVLGYPDAVVKALKYDSQFTDYWVQGTFTTPYFLADQDGVATPMYPADDDESFDVDPVSGTAHHGPSTVSFLCSIPKATDKHKPPFPVMLYGHGYSGAPFEIFGFAGRMAQFGFALCSMDSVAHGMALPSDEDIPYDTIIPTILEPMGLMPFYDAFKGGRIRDLDNDGELTSFDNGGDFWSYDMFHTRDMVRQAVIDGIQFVRIMRSLGDLKWAADSNGNGIADDLMGDFNGDGTIDLGGPEHTSYPVWGQSLGAIVAQVMAAVEGTVTASTPISGGGGLAQVGIRSTNPGVPEAVLMPFMGPFVIFKPLGDEEDSVEVAFMINDLHRENRPHQPNRPHYYPVAHTTAIRPGDRVIVRNLVNGEEVRAFRHPDGRGFRVSLPSDALTAVEKRPLLGLRDGDTQPVPVSCAPGSWSIQLDDKGKPSGPATCPQHDLTRALLFGDAFEIEVLDGWDGPAKARIDTFEKEVTFQGAVFPTGAPLVALGPGFGNPRNTPSFRRLIGFASMILARGDPASYARHYQKGERLDFSYDPGAAQQANMIIYHTVGDPNVPIATSLTLARGAGILQYLPEGNQSDSPNDRLLAGYVAEGVEGFWRYLSTKYTVIDWNDKNKKLKDMRWPDEFTDLLDIVPPLPMPLHADPDDLDNGTDEYGETNLAEPIRATAVFDEASGSLKFALAPKTGVLKNDVGVMALRFPYITPLGAHGVEPSNPGKAFDVNNLVENQIGLFCASQGQLFSDDPCLADSTCDFLPESVRK